MQMNFIKTPLDNGNIGKELYFLAYNKNEKFFVKKVTFMGLDCKEYSGNSEYYSDTEFYCAIFEYIDDKGKNKQFKLKWSYSKHDKPKYKKSKNFVYFEEEQLTCIKTQNCDPGYYCIYISEKHEIMDKYINENKIFDNIISSLTKKRNALDKQITEITNIKY